MTDPRLCECIKLLPDMGPVYQRVCSYWSQQTTASKKDIDKYIGMLGVPEFPSHPVCNSNCIALLYTNQKEFRIHIRNLIEAIIVLRKMGWHVGYTRHTGKFLRSLTNGYDVRTDYSDPLLHCPTGTGWWNVSYPKPPSPPPVFMPLKPHNIAEANFKDKLRALDPHVCTKYKKKINYTWSPASIVRPNIDNLLPHTPYLDKPIDVYGFNLDPDNWPPNSDWGRENWFKKREHQWYAQFYTELSVWWPNETYKVQLNDELKCLPPCSLLPEGGVVYQQTMDHYHQIAPSCL